MMNNSRTDSPRPLARVPAIEREQEAAGGGIESDEQVEGGDDDTHLPASEVEFLKDEKLGRPGNADIIPPPPD